MNGLIKDRTLWDSLGNFCRVQLYQIGPDSFELYLHRFNDATPVRYIGRLGLMINIGEVFLDCRKRDGFMEPQPIDNPEAWIA